MGAVRDMLVLWAQVIADRERGERRPLRSDAAKADVSDLTHWVYELLDAHSDTSRLAADLGVDASWQAHLDYLRDLQRRGREALARAHA